MNFINNFLPIFFVAIFATTTFAQDQNCNWKTERECLREIARHTEYDALYGGRPFYEQLVPTNRNGDGIHIMSLTCFKHILDSQVKAPQYEISDVLYTLWGASTDRDSILRHYKHKATFFWSCMRNKYNLPETWKSGIERYYDLFEYNYTNEQKLQVATTLNFAAELVRKAYTGVNEKELEEFVLLMNDISNKSGSDWKWMYTESDSLMREQYRLLSKAWDLPNLVKEEISVIGDPYSILRFDIPNLKLPLTTDLSQEIRWSTRHTSYHQFLAGVLHRRVINFTGKDISGEEIKEIWKAVEEALLFAAAKFEEG